MRCSHACSVLLTIQLNLILLDSAWALGSDHLVTRESQRIHNITALLRPRCAFQGAYGNRLGGSVRCTVDRQCRVHDVAICHGASTVATYRVCGVLNDDRGNDVIEIDSDWVRVDDRRMVTTVVAE